MFSLQMGIRNPSDLWIESRIDCLDKGRFSDTGLAGKKIDLSLTCLTDLIDSLTGFNRGFDNPVTGPFINTLKSIDLLLGNIPVHIDLAENNRNRNAIDLTGNEDTVEKGQLDLGKVQRDNNISSVDIGRDNMGLTGKIRRAADYVIRAGQDLRDQGRGIQGIVCLITDPVADGDRIGNLAGLEPDLSAQHGRKEIPLGKGGKQIMASRIFYNRCFTLGNHATKLVNLHFKMKNMTHSHTLEETVRELFDGITFTREPEGLYDPLRYMIGIGGKRLRPTLCLLTWSLYRDGFPEEILGPAAGLEVFHTFTLIHDDIMDNSPLRRGCPTVWKKWSPDTAILSGDVMCIDSYKRIAKAPAVVLPEVLDLFSTTAAQVCDGQQFDMDFETRETVPMEEYMQMIGLKTAVLLACSAKMGALIAGAPKSDCDALYGYGYKLGLAFQIADDYLDAYGDSKVFGKPIGGDIVNNKKSWLTVRAFEKGAEGLPEALALPAGTEREREEKIQGVKAIYDAAGVPGDALDEIARLTREALDEVSAFPARRQEKLLSFAEKLIGRTR